MQLYWTFRQCFNNWQTVCNKKLSVWVYFLYKIIYLILNIHFVSFKGHHIFEAMAAVENLWKKMIVIYIMRCLGRLQTN